MAGIDGTAEISQDAIDKLNYGFGVSDDDL